MVLVMWFCCGCNWLGFALLGGDPASNPMTSGKMNRRRGFDNASIGTRFGVQGPGFRVPGSKFMVQVSRFRFQGSGFRFPGSGFRVRVQGSRFQGSRVSGFQVCRVSRFQSSGFRDQG